MRQKNYEGSGFAAVASPRDRLVMENGRAWWVGSQLCLRKPRGLPRGNTGVGAAPRGRASVVYGMGGGKGVEVSKQLRGPRFRQALVHHLWLPLPSPPRRGFPWKGQKL